MGCSFRERFNAWKQGKDVYKNGRPIRLDEGKDAENLLMEVDQPDLEEAKLYLQNRKLDLLQRYDSGKDAVAGGYNFNAIKLVSPNAGLSYGSYYDKLTGDIIMDARRSAVPRFNDGKSGTSPISLFVERLSPKVYKQLIRRGISNPDKVHDFIMRLLSHESANGTSRNARVNHNYAGMGWNGKTYYHYNSDDEFLEDYLNLLQRRYSSALSANTIEDYAKALKNGGYYEDSILNYTNGLKNVKTLANTVANHKKNNASMYILSDRDMISLPKGYKPTREERKDNTRVAKLNVPEYITAPSSYIQTPQWAAMLFNPSTYFYGPMANKTPLAIVPNRSVGLNPNEFL